MTELGRKGDWILTFTGKHFWPLDPRVEDFDLRDIAHSLALKCRWTGHCSRFYSVATHSLRVAQVALFLAQTKYKLNETEQELIWFYGVSHEAPEAYTADFVGVLKRFFPAWKEMENKIDETFYQFMGINPPSPFHKSIIKEADNILLKIESEELFPKDAFKGSAMDDIKITMDHKIIAAYNSEEDSEDLLLRSLNSL